MAGGGGSNGGGSSGGGSGSDGSGSDGPEGSDGSGSNGGGSDGDGSTGGDGDASAQVSTAEKVVMVASAPSTVALFGFALWHAVAGAGAVPPTADVVGSQPVPDGGVIYDVQLRNEGDVGLVTVTISVECTQPPAELESENVPAQGQRSGSVHRPPGTTDPAVTVSLWVRE